MYKSCMQEPNKENLSKKISTIPNVGDGFWPYLDAPQSTPTQVAA